jgi:hypothetical protein
MGQYDTGRDAGFYERFLLAIIPALLLFTKAMLYNYIEKVFK